MQITLLCVIMCGMKSPLTSKQKAILAFITDLTNKNGIEPTLEEIRVQFNYANASSVQRHTDALKDKGYLKNVRGLELMTDSQKVQIPLVGNVACGMPLLATENIEAYILVDKNTLRGNPDNYFFLKAVGDSMNDADIGGKTIDNGDYVLVKKQNTAERGNRIVALIGDDATIKKFVPETGSIRLEPESTNKANKPIIMFEDFSVQGIAVDVFKKGGE